MKQGFPPIFNNMKYSLQPCYFQCDRNYLLLGGLICTSLAKIMTCILIRCSSKNTTDI